MKFFYRFLLIGGFLLGSFSTIQAQSDPFKAKKKVVPAEGVRTQGPQKLNSAPIQVNHAPIPHTNYSFQTIAGSPGTKVDREWLNKQQKTQVMSWSDEGLPIHIITQTQVKSAQLFQAPDPSVFQTTLTHLNSIQPVLGIEHPELEFRLKNISRDDLGFSHVKMEQVYLGVPVFASELIVHYSPNNEIIVNGRYQATPKLTDVNPDISVEAAIETAMDDLSQKAHVRELTEAEQELFNYAAPHSELVIFQTDGYVKQQKLAWHLTIIPNILHEWEYFIDAETGVILNDFDHICNIGPVTGSDQDLNGQTQSIKLYEYGNSQFVMINTQTSMYKFPNDPNHTPAVRSGEGVIATLDWQNNSNRVDDWAFITSTNNNNWSAIAVSAHSNAEIVYNYFEDTLARRSFDGNGGDLTSFINVADENGRGMDNAFWSQSSNSMYYGNGGSAFTSLAGALDVAAHEITHGVIQETANLVYQNEPGALNESFADVFGVLIDRDDFGLGEDIIPNTQIFPTGLLRDVSNPNNGYAAGSNPLQTNGYQPAHVNDQYLGQQDNGGVHINSGIPNKAFHNLVTSTSKAEAEQIYYRALSVYLTRSSEFIDCRIAIIQAAADRHGANSSQVTAARAAFDAVGITDGTGTNTNPTVPINSGNESIVSSDVNATDPNTLYISDPAATNFSPLTTSTHRKRISVTDDGSVGYFSDSTGVIHRINMDANNPSEVTLFTTQGWPPFDNVAVSKDGTKLAMLTTQVDTSIYIVSFTRNEFLIYKFFNPTTAQGVSTGDVLFADAITWDLSGEQVLYDAFNIIRSATSDDIEYWDLGLIRVWDNSAGNFGDGQVQKLFSGLEVGENIGNAVFSKNSPNVIAFDFFNNNTGENLVMAANIETGDIGTIFTNSQLGYPTYSVNDGQLLFDTPVNVQGQSVPGIAVIGLASNKISPSGTAATALIANGRWAEWYADGQRSTQTSIEDYVESGTLALFPNPVDNLLQLEFELKETAEVEIRVLDIMGKKQMSLPAKTMGVGINTSQLKLADLASGVYLLQLDIEGSTQTLKFVKN